MAGLQGMTPALKMLRCPHCLLACYGMGEARAHEVRNSHMRIAHKGVDFRPWGAVQSMYQTPAQAGLSEED